MKPLGVPASATIWAEVEVVKRRAAWFEPRKNQWCPAGVVLDNPTGGNFWTPENSDKYWHPQTAAQCRQLYERGMAEQAKVDAFVERVERAAKGDPVRIAEAIVAARARPACIPSHIPDTDWTVIEGRAVWRDSDSVRIERPGIAPVGVYEGWTTQQKACIRDGDVPPSLFLAARRWMGWEKEEAAPEPVPRAAMWNVVGDGAFAEPFGTIRKCADCGCLVAGGPTRCSRCAEGGAP